MSVKTGQVSDRWKLPSLSMLLNSSILVVGVVGLEDRISCSSCKKSGDSVRGLFLVTERGTGRGVDCVGGLLGRALDASSLRLFGLGGGRL